MVNYPLSERKKDPPIVERGRRLTIRCSRPICRAIFVENHESDCMHKIRAWVDGGMSEGLLEWLVADECPSEVEFVPEPGSILLLGSGLAGLAGYATLRWRARE